LERHFQGTNTVFTGFLHGQALAEAYASADLFMFPSTTETLGLVLLEAMASGLPVVAVKSGPTCEQVEDGVTGLLFDESEADSMSSAVRQLADPERRAQLSHQAALHARRFGWAQPSEQLLGLYERVLKERRPAPAHIQRSEHI
jgi:glycosyltransferase involved in cell wall biosynthesis